jgi:hypothetical protein
MRDLAIKTDELQSQRIMLRIAADYGRLTERMQERLASK